MQSDNFYIASRAQSGAKAEGIAVGVMSINVI